MRSSFRAACGPGNDRIAVGREAGPRRLGRRLIPNSATRISRAEVQIEAGLDQTIPAFFHRARLLDEHGSRFEAGGNASAPARSSPSSGA